jgi:hypothetical protein
MDKEVSASANEIGVLEDLTITSATSDKGIALRRVRGGVVREDDDEPGAENSLLVSLIRHGAGQNSLHPYTFSNTLEPTQSTPSLELLLLSSSRHVDFVATIDCRSEGGHRTFRCFTTFLDLKRQSLRLPSA